MSGTRVSEMHLRSSVPALQMPLTACLYSLARSRERQLREAVAPWMFLHPKTCGCSPPALPALGLAVTGRELRICRLALDELVPEVPGFRSHFPSSRLLLLL